MTSKIVVNNIEADSGINTITFINEVTAPTFNGNIVGTAATFSGNVDIAGALTYEDVTNVDSVGIVTARSGIHVTGGNVGIGTDNPTQKLVVKGVSSLVATNSTNAWMPYTYTDNSFRLNYNGAGDDEVTVTSGGNMSLGTSTGLDFSLLDGLVINTSNGNAGVLINSSSSSHNAYLGFSYGSGSSTSHADQFSAYIGRVGDDTLILGTNNNIRVRLDSTGRLLISGQAALNSTSLSHPIQVASASDANAIAIFGRAADDIGELSFYEADKSTKLGELQYRQDHLNFRHRVGDIRFATGGTTERLRINSAGQMILGTASNLGTVPPKFTIVNDTNSSTFSACQLLRLNGPGAVGERGGIGFHYANSLNHGEKPSSFIGVETVAAGGAQQTDLLFATRPNTSDSEPTERVRITSGGLVNVTGGIQVTENITPTSGRGVEIFESGTGVGQIQSYNRNSNGWDELRIKGSELKLYAGTTNTLTLNIQSSQSTLYGTSDGILNLDTTDGRGSFIRFKENGNTKAWVGCAEGMGGGTSSPDQDDLGLRAVGNILFSSNGSERLRINENGEIEVKGDAFISINEGSPSGNYFQEIAYAPNTKGCLYLENFAYYGSQPALVINDQDTNNARVMEDVQFHRAGTMRGYIRINPSNVTYSTSGSDIRLKKNFEDWTEDNLSKFKTLSPKLFNWVDDEDGTEKTKGFIAQDNLDKFPEAYDLTVSTDRYYFNPSGMVHYMMKALQEAATKIETMEARIAALEGS